MELVWPASEYLPSYVAAIRQGWSPNNVNPNAGFEDLARIESDPDRFLAEHVDREAKAPPVVLPDGTTVRRLPGIRRWMWDGEFCGIISLRWQPGTAELPPHVLGHIGFAVADTHASSARTRTPRASHRACGT